MAFFSYNVHRFSIFETRCENSDQKLYQKLRNLLVVFLCFDKHTRVLEIRLTFSEPIWKSKLHRFREIRMAFYLRGKIAFQRCRIQLAFTRREMHRYIDFRTVF